MTTICLFSLLLSATLLCTQLKTADASNFGVCYARLGSNIMPPPDKVARLLDIYKIGRLRIYYPDHKYFRALNGSNVQLAVGIQNDKVYIIASDLKEANNWFYNYIAPYVGYVRFRYIVVGHKNVINENSAQDVLRAMTNLYIVISSLGLQNQIKITTEVGSNVLDNHNLFQPEATFKYSSYAGNYMAPIAKFLASHDSPLFIINYPHSFFETENRQECGDFKSLNAINMFTSTIDVFYSAMEKVGGENVRLVVGETGWPSAGKNGEQDEIANHYNAKKYIWDLANHVLSTRGTPERPGQQIETYVYSLFNGNPGDGLWEHFGMFYPDMQPVCEIPHLQ